MRYTIPIIVTALLFGCCTSNNHSIATLEVIDSSEVIEVSNPLSQDPSVSFEDMVDSLTFIPLETSDNCVVSDIRSIAISQKYIYVLDYNYAIFVFDINGRFVRRIPKGQGPDEISYARVLCFDSENKLLYVFDSSQGKMLVFNEDGTFRNNYYPENHISMEDFEYFDGEFIVVPTVSLRGNQEMEVLVCDSVLNTRKIVSLGKVNPRISINKYLQKCSDKVVISKVLSKDIYNYSQGSFCRKYILDDNNYDASLMYMGNTWETDQYQCFLFIPNTNGAHERFIVRNKKTNSIWCNKFVPNSVFNGIDPMGFRIYDYYDNKIFSVIYPGYSSIGNSDYHWDGSNPNNLISEADMEKLKAIKSDDNPVIVLLKLKNI